MACVAPKNNSVVIKMNKPSPGFFKRHSVAGVINGSEAHTAAALNICVDVDEWIELMNVCMKSTMDTKVLRSFTIYSQSLL